MDQWHWFTTDCSLCWIYENAYLNGKLNDSLIISNPKYVQYVDNSTISGHWTCLMNINNNYNVYQYAGSWIHEYINLIRWWTYLQKAKFIDLLSIDWVYLKPLKWLIQIRFWLELDQKFCERVSPNNLIFWRNISNEYLSICSRLIII